LIGDWSTASPFNFQANARSGGRPVHLIVERGFVIPFILVRVTAYAIAAVAATLILGTISERLIRFDEATTVLLFGLVIGAINAFIKPVVKVVTLPITCITFGIFALVVNTVLFYAGAMVTPGIELSWWGAIFGSMLTSAGSGLIFSVIDE